MMEHNKMDPVELRSKIKYGAIAFGGNSKLKIYGKLQCASGKRLKKENRVFFRDEKEALDMGYRPCGNCMKTTYVNWKNGTIS